MEYVAGVLIGVCFVMLYGYMALREKAAELESLVVSHDDELEKLTKQLINVAVYCGAVRKDVNELLEVDDGKDKAGD